MFVFVMLVLVVLLECMLLVVVFALMVLWFGQLQNLVG